MTLSEGTSERGGVHSEVKPVPPLPAAEMGTEHEGEGLWCVSSGFIRAGQSPQQGSVEYRAGQKQGYTVQVDHMLISPPW